jgi:uncharacterized protein (DUF1778 family)
MSTEPDEFEIQLRLPREWKACIEAAAAYVDQSLEEFAASTLLEASRRVVAEQQVTRLSESDCKAFVALLEEASTEPNAALLQAAERYREQVCPN